MKILDFIDETKREIAKVTWPTRREVSMTTIMIVLMALAGGVFFFLVDGALGFGIGKILGMTP